MSDSTKGTARPCACESTVDVRVRTTIERCRICGCIWYGDADIIAAVNAHARLQAEHDEVTALLKVLEPLVFLKDRRLRVYTAIRNVKEARGDE